MHSVQGRAMDKLEHGTFGCSHWCLPAWLCSGLVNLGHREMSGHSYGGSSVSVPKGGMNQIFFPQSYFEPSNKLCAFREPHPSKARLP